MSAESPGARDRISRLRRGFRHWRWQRPFWAGLLTLLAGLPIGYLPYANVTLGQLTVRMSTTAGSGSLIIGVLLIVLGLTMWFQPVVRVFAGVATILLGLVSLPVSNFGGFLVGFLLALFGGGMSVAWAPGEAPAAQPAKDAGPAPDGGADGEDGAAGPDGADGGEPEPATAGAAPDQESRNGRHRAG
ncbi:DUF6114 domain-containing protein [Streptomyces cuspidosporus]|uniref:Integral membrane protein n=1 Tax=Streptomyces cuspidosporus TaxID=66882 RepID=A0ABN3G325_9ACTN